MSDLHGPGDLSDPFSALLDRMRPQLSDSKGQEASFVAIPGLRCRDI